jgi:hypothetical protein
MTKKQSIFKLLIISLIMLTVLLGVGFFFFSKGKEKEKQISRISSIEKRCFKCNKKISENADFCQNCSALQNFQDKQESILKTKKQKNYPLRTIKIQKTTSGKYFVNFSYSKEKKDENSQEYSFTKGKNCFSIEEMPEILTKYQEC